MMVFNERRKAFIEEMQSSIKEFEANATKHCDTSVGADYDELMAELERKFDELFGAGSD